MTMDIIWDLKVTPGAIVASAIFACYTLSNDTVFQHQGNSTKIDYEADFNTYLKCLISSHQDNRQSVKRIFQTWNLYFFPSTTRLDVTILDAPAQVIDDVFAALNDDDQEEFQQEFQPASSLDPLRAAPRSFPLTHPSSVSDT
ncbi:hypothetical protein K439DRAFT_1620883 [Ramaria rubella]|nr:hypothetical protein K439DRAFT_1620883 [Ramaria rubella]